MIEINRFSAFEKTKKADRVLFQNLSVKMEERGVVLLRGGILKSICRGVIRQI